MLDDEERARERADLAWQAREHPFLDDYHLACSPDWSKIEVPLLSAGNWGRSGPAPARQHPWLRAGRVEREVAGDAHRQPLVAVLR
jgi:hypothetical protein